MTEALMISFFRFPIFLNQVLLIKRCLGELRTRDHIGQRFVVSGTAY